VDAIDELIDEGLHEVVGSEAPPWLSARVRSRLGDLEGRKRGGFLAALRGAGFWQRLAGAVALAAAGILLFVLLRSQPSPSVADSVAENRPAADDRQAQGTGQPAVPGPLAATPERAGPATVPGAAERAESGKEVASAAGNVRRPVRRGPLVMARSGDEARRMGLARVPEIERTSGSAVYVLAESARPATGDAGQAGGISSGELEAQPIDVAPLPAPAPLDIPALEVAPIAVTEIVIRPIAVKPIDPAGPRAPAAGGTGNEESHNR